MPGPLVFDKGREKENRERGGWRRYLLSWLLDTIALDGYIGWDVDDQNRPCYVMIEHTRGPEDSEVESLAICREFDDLAMGLFGYRDWTSSGLPFVQGGELYWSGWWFQFKEDAVAFQEFYGGVGTWQDGYEEWAAACNTRRETQG